jgi:hypothetical protein
MMIWRSRLPLRMLLAALGAVWTLLQPSPLSAGEWSGQVSLELRTFFHAPLDPEQPRVSSSAFFRVEFYHEWSEGTQSLLAVPYFRLDQTDPERTHFDIRELFWQKVADTWEVRAGVGKVFWGVTESQHLVDIINQTDFVENIDGEEKLGQPMVNLALMRSWGTLDLFVLPGFRKRTFPGEKGRPGFPLRVATELTQFSSSAEERHVDGAVRWSHIIGDWDIGVAHFYGTSREPIYLPGVDESGQPVLIPFYDIINQTSLDLQATKGAWLWKFEALTRGGQGDRFTALTGGLEYTFFNLRDSGIDLGLLFEYLFDSRGQTLNSPFDDDIFLATRLALNDVVGTELLAGVTIDRETGASFISVESSRRLTDHWKIDVELRAFVGFPEGDPFSWLQKDDYLQFALAWYF